MSCQRLRRLHLKLKLLDFRFQHHADLVMTPRLHAVGTMVARIRKQSEWQRVVRGTKRRLANLSKVKRVQMSGCNCRTLTLLHVLYMGGIRSELPAIFRYDWEL